MISPATAEATILLSLDSRGDREKLRNHLSRSESYTVIDGDDPRNVDQSVDLWILDTNTFERKHSILSNVKDAQKPHYFPILLLCPDDQLSALTPTVWKRIDDVVGLPITPAILDVRMENLLRTRTLAREALTSQQRFESLVHTTSSAIVFLTPDATIRFVNDACTTLFGYDREELLGYPITRLIPPRLQDAAAEGIEQYRSRLTKAHTGSTLESSGQHKDGHEIPIQLAYGWFTLDDEIYLTGIITETSTLKQRETRLQVLNRVLRHDIRNDMNVVLGYAELLADEFPEANQYIETILSAANDVIRLSEQAEELDQLFNTDQKTKQRIDVSSLVTEKCGEFRDRYPEATVKTVGTDGEAIHVEAINLLESAIDNLLENAIEHNDAATPEVTVSVTTQQGLENELVLVEIADNGPGLPPEEVEVIQTGTETALDHASGLGLWLVNWIVTESDGQIHFFENEPRGCCITLTLLAA